MDYRITCFERVLYLVEELPEGHRDEALAIVDRIAEVSDIEAVELADKYLDLLSYIDHAEEHNAARKMTLHNGIVLFDSVKDNAETILNFEVFVKILEKSGFEPAELEDLYDRAKGQDEKKCLDFLYTPYDVVLSRLQPWKDMDDLRTAASIMDEPVREYLDFLSKGNPHLTANDINILWEGIVMWEDYESNHSEEDYDRLTELFDKTGLTNESKNHAIQENKDKSSHYSLPDIKYYDEELGINATANELYIQVRNGYRSSVAEIERIAEILRKENKDLEARYCDFEVEAIQETIRGQDEDFNFARIKQDILYREIHGSSNGQKLYMEFQYEEGLDAVIEQNPAGDFMVAIGDNDGNANTALLSSGELLCLDRKGFEEFMNSLNFYMTREDAENIPDDLSERDI